MTAGFGGQGYVKQETRALSSIEETAGPDLSQGQDAAIKMLQQHESQIKFLASQMKQAQAGVNEANQNPIQQIQQFVADIIVLFGGGELAEGALDFGDLQYILPAIGALFGFGDGPFPISLFEAAEKFFFGYVVPNAQFVDVINNIIQAWLGLLGIDPKFIKDVKDLITAFGDLFDGISNLFPSLNELFGALGVSGTNLGPLGQALGPIMRLFSGLDISQFGNMIEFITDAIDPFIKSLTAIINWVDSVLAIFGFGGDVVNSPLNDSSLPFHNLLRFLGGIDFADILFNPIQAAITFITNVLSPTGLLAQLVGGFLSGSVIPGLDASKIISGFIGDGLLPVINSIIGGITGLIPGAPGSHNDVADAAAAQSAVLAAISASVAKLEAAFADSDPATILVEEDFEYTAAAPDPAKWDIDNYGSQPNQGHPLVDGHQLKWSKNGAGTHGTIMRFIDGSNAQSSKDDMTVKIVVGTNTIPTTQPGSPSALDVLARINLTNDTYVRLRVFRGSFTLSAINGGAETVIGSQSLSTVPGVGAIITLQCGDDDDHRNFFVTINGTTWEFFDGTAASQVGALYRWRGMGQLAGQVVFLGITTQENAGPVAHWASQNAA